jgi:uncharacterized small protein (DUF1192 family)
VEFLRDQVADGHKRGLSVTWQTALTDELERAKAELSKVSGSNSPTGAKATRDFLQARADGAPAASEAAQERHQGHLAALTTEIARLQEIHAHKVKDFAEAQTAFAARLVEDKEALKATMDSIAKTIGTDGTTPMEVSVPNVTQTAEDLHRHFLVKKEDIPECPTTVDQTVCGQMSALWHFYSAASTLDSFAPLPCVTFKDMGVTPSVIHTLVGPKAWDGFWGATAGDIKEEQHIPHTMHKILMHVVDQRKTEFTGLTSAGETAAKRLKAAMENQTGKPF